MSKTLARLYFQTDKRESKIKTYGGNMFRNGGMQFRTSIRVNVPRLPFRCIRPSLIPTPLPHQTRNPRSDRGSTIASENFVQHVQNLKFRLSKWTNHTLCARKLRPALMTFSPDLRKLLLGRK